MLMFHIKSNGMWEIIIIKGLGGRKLYIEQFDSMFVLSDSFIQSKHQSKPGISYYNYYVHDKLESGTVSAKIGV